MDRILVALDTSDNADFVLDQAIELAEATDAKLRLIRVVHEAAAPPASIFAAEPSVDFANSLVTVAESDLLCREGRIPPRHRDGVIVVVGEPYKEICKAAQSYGSHLVVLGAHQHGILERVLGTTASKVVNHVDRPVFIVRPVAPVVRKGREANRATRDSHHAPHRSADHPLLEATTLAGATAGVVVGAIGGPPGVIAGGVIGTTIGMLAGSTLDKQDHDAERHDRALDDAIGVTRGDLGARERAVGGLNAMQHAERVGTVPLNDGNGDGETMMSLAAVLRAEHQRLDGIYANLLSAYREGEWEHVRAAWAAFEPVLRAHMEREEKTVFPAFRAAAPVEADRLAGEHAELRRLLDTIGIGIELHAFPHSDAEALVTALRSHGAREERILYPWLEEPHVVDMIGKLSAA
jgi:nucleotide-binding universal stress UspA family protein